MVDACRKAVADHLDAIAAELNKDLGSRLWRVREASCHALAALIQVITSFKVHASL